MNRQYKLFFSWQSEDKKSRKTLDVALQNAVEALNDRGIRLEIDHSTLGESGMPSIDQTILRKNRCLRYISCRCNSCDNLSEVIREWDASQ